MSTMNLFEYATRNKLRFNSARGQLTVEQLWDVPLRSEDGFDLNAVAKDANDALKTISEENFVEPAKTAGHARAEALLEVVKHVIDCKLVDETAAKKRTDNKVRREKLLAVLAEKQDGKLSALSEKELKRQIEELENES